MAEGAESFRAGWQSLLAALASSGNGLGDSGAAAEQGDTSTGAAPEVAAGESSGATASLAADLGPHLRQKTEIGSGETGTRIDTRPAIAWAGDLPTRPAAGTTKATSAMAEGKEKKPAAESGTESSASTRPTLSTNVVHAVQPVAVAAEPMPGLIPAAAIVVPLEIAPAPVVASKPSSSSDAKAQSPQTDLSYTYLSIALPAGLASASFRSYPLSSGDSSQAAGAAKAAIQEGTERKETLAKPAQVLPAPGPSWPSGPVLSATDLPIVKQTAPPPGTTRGADESPLQAVRQDRNPTQTVATSPKQIPVLSSNRSPVPAFVPGQNQIKPLASSLNSTQTAAPSENPPQVLAKSQNRIQPLVPGSNPAPEIAPVQSWPEIAASQIVTPRTNLAETPALNGAASQTIAGRQNSKQTQKPGASPALKVAPEQSADPRLVFGQSSSPTLVSGQTRAAAAAVSQDPIQRPAQVQDPAQAVTPVQSGPETLFPGVSLTQPQAPSENQIQTSVPVETRTEAIMPGQNQTQTVESSRKPIQTPAPSEEPIQRPVVLSGPNLPQTFDSNQNRTQSAAPTRDPIQPAIPSPSPAQAAAPEESATPQAPSQKPTQRSVPVAPQTHADVPGENGAQMEASSKAQLPALESSQELAQPSISGPGPRQPVAPEQSVASAPTPGQKLTPQLVPSQSASQTVVPDQTRTRAVESSQNPIHTLTPWEDQIQPLMPGPSLSRTVAPEQGTTPTSAPSPNLIQRSAPVVTQTHAVVPGQSQIRTVMSSEDLIQTSAPEQGPTQTVAPSQKPIQTAAPPRNPTHAEAANQNAARTFARSKDEVPMQPEMPGVGTVRALPGSKDLAPPPVTVGASASQSGQSSTAPLNETKPSLAGGKKPLASATAQSAPGVRHFDSVQPASLRAEVQPSGPVVDLSAMARELTGARGAVSVAGEPAGASAIATTGPDAREVFAALDGASAAGKPTWIHAGAHRAEAGFQDPALGWVAVRADTGSGGGVHAELVPATANAAQTLGSHLAGLNAYLAEHHTPVAAVTLTAPESGWSGLGGDRGAGQNMQQGAGQQTGQEAAQSADTGSQSGSSGSSTVLPTAASELTASLGELDGSTEAARPGEIHISVMA